MVKLEMCPHCGGAGEIKDIPKPFRHGWVGCHRCGIIKQWTYSPKEAIERWNRRYKVETSVYDKEEIIEDCTVQILTNSFTGEQSVGWWKTGERP